MKTRTKQILAALGFMGLWFAFVAFAADLVVSVAVLAIAGWQIGQWVVQLARMLFPDRKDQS